MHLVRGCQTASHQVEIVYLFSTLIRYLDISNRQTLRRWKGKQTDTRTDRTAVKMKKKIKLCI